MINLRKASNKDCRLTWKWSSDPVVRAESFVSDPIPYHDHVEWFKQRISDPDCYLFIAENSDHKPIGQIRFEIEGNDATVSISLDQEFRNKGYGSTIIALASQNIFKITKANLIHAYIKKHNTASTSAFKKAGYIFSEAALIKGQHADHLILEKKNESK
jgi:UDP-2,4-diacetamido-2,4,6-trideoxy-beta-L-altropyranose hydrolase